MVSLNGCRFASLRYTSKQSNETADYQILLGFSYHELVRRSVRILMTKIQLYEGTQKEAALELLASFKKTLEAHEKGEQNPDYTKKDLYIPLISGLNISKNDESLQLFGLCIKKTVIEPGVWKQVKSSPIVIEKNAIRKELPIGRFREFALDSGVIDKATIQGKTIKF